MLPRRTPLAALAAVTTVLAVAVPAASARTTAAVPVDPQVCQLLNAPLPAQAFGGGSLTRVLAQSGATVGCAAPAPQQQRSRSVVFSWLR